MRSGHVPGQRIHQKPAKNNEIVDPPAQQCLHFRGCRDVLFRRAFACTHLNGTERDRMGHAWDTPHFIADLTVKMEEPADWQSAPQRAGPKPTILHDLG